VTFEALLDERDAIDALIPELLREGFSRAEPDLDRPGKGVRGRAPARDLPQVRSGHVQASAGLSVSR
jgi:hypothetical protein